MSWAAQEAAGKSWAAQEAVSKELGRAAGRSGPHRRQSAKGWAAKEAAGRAGLHRRQSAKGWAAQESAGRIGSIIGFDTLAGCCRCGVH